MNDQVKVGDDVFLNSGSPELRVVAITPQLTVEWQDGDETRRATLPAVCFHPVTAIPA